MIEGWIGRPGSGKTMTLTARALRARDRGQAVFTNYPVSGCYEFGPSDLLTLPPGLIIIDEAHLWFPARGAMQLPMSWLAELSQTRKNGWDLIWAAQHEGRVDRVVRDVTSWMYLTKSWFPTVSGRPRFFSVQCWEPEDFRKAGKVQTKSWSRFSWPVATSYDTMAKIEQAAHTRQKADVYAKQEASSVVPPAPELEQRNTGGSVTSSQLLEVERNAPVPVYPGTLR